MIVEVVPCRIIKSKATRQNGIVMAGNPNGERKAAVACWTTTTVATESNANRADPMLGK